MYMGLSTRNAYKGVQEYITQQYGLGVCIWDIDKGICTQGHILRDAYRSVSTWGYMLRGFMHQCRHFSRIINSMRQHPSRYGVLIPTLLCLCVDGDTHQTVAQAAGVRGVWEVSSIGVFFATEGTA